MKTILILALLAWPVMGQISCFGCASSGGGSGPTRGTLAVSLTSPTVLTIGATCSIATPCLYRIGSSVFVVSAPATATISSGTGAAFVYVDAGTGNLIVGLTSASVACLGCLVVDGVSAFPVDSIPLASWNATTDGQWDATGSNALAVLSAAPQYVPGSGVTLTQAASSLIIATN